MAYSNPSLLSYQRDRDTFTNLLHRENIKRGQTVSYHLWDSPSSLWLGACGLQLFSFFNFFGGALN